MAKLTLTILPNFQQTEKSIADLKAKIESLTQTLSLKGVKVDGSVIKGLEQLKTTLAGIKIDNTTVQGVRALTEHYKQLGIVVRNIAKEYGKLSAFEDKRNRSVKTTTSTIQSLQKKYADLLSTIKGLESKYPAGTFDSLKASVQANLDQIKALNAEIGDKAPTAEQTQRLQQLTSSYQSLSAQVATVRAETEKHTTAVIQNGDSILKMAKKFVVWQAAATLVMKPLQWIRNALSSINETLVETEDAVISLQRVLPSGSASDDEISSRLYKIAQDYGQTFENVSEIAQNFARSGMDWADTIKATESAVLALNVAELDAGEATNGMIAIMSQFNLEASDLETVIDKLNKTADNFPVTTEKILAALQRTGSAASNANLSLDETISLVTALSKATGRSGENIGTALNSLIQYSSKSSALETFANLSDEATQVVENYRKGLTKANGKTYNILDVWRQVSKEIQNIDSRQADLLDSYFATEDGSALKEALDGELEDIYTELGGVYDTANTFRKNYFIALLGNMDTVEQAMGTLNDAQGYSQTENEKYLETYTAKLNSLQAKWQEVANDEQGLLGIKKDLVDLGVEVLNIIQGVGGLKTALVALGVVVGTIVATTKGAQIVAGLQLVGKTIKSLTVDAIPNFIATLRAWRGQATLLNGQVVTLTGSTATFGQVLKASLPIITMVIVAISALDSAIRRHNEEEAEEDRKRIEQQNEAIKKSNEDVEAQKKEIAQIEELAPTVESLRKILDDSSQSEEEKAKAQNKLLQIQNTLVDSNNAYKDSLDLTNGSLKEQLGLIDQLTTEQLKQKANDFLKSNESEIEIANSRLESASTTNTDMVLGGAGNDRFRFRDIINNAIQGAGISNAGIIEDNTYGFFHGWGKDIAESWEEGGFFDALGSIFVDGFTNMFSEEGWTGEAQAGLSFSGTIEQQIDAITKLRNYIAQNKDTLGLSAEEVVSITTELGNKLSELNSEEYKQAQLLAERAKLADDYLNKRITEEEYLEKFYGIEKDISQEVGEQTNDISKVTGAYDDLIKKLEEFRDLQKESTNWEEKKLAVLEAEQALENARNEATVRRFDESTGQWEWQTDEKAIAEAEENLEKAQLDLQEMAYDKIIGQLEKGDATNESILAILQEVAPLLGADSNFVEVVTNAFKEKTGVDITKPSVSTFDAAQNYITSNGLKESDREKWTEDKVFAGLWNKLTADEQAKLKGTYDSGGIANGLGLMAKATAEPEVVCDPELTKKILSPVSTKEFDAWVKANNIMFAQAHDYARMPSYQRVNNTTNNRVDNSGQITMNGVTIGSNGRGNTLDELLTLAKIVPNT